MFAASLVPVVTVGEPSDSGSLVSWFRRTCARFHQRSIPAAVDGPAIISLTSATNSLQLTDSLVKIAPVARPVQSMDQSRAFLFRHAVG